MGATSQQQPSAAAGERNTVGSSRTVLLPAPVVDWRAGDCDLALDPAAPWDWVGFCDRLAPLLVLFADVGKTRKFESSKT